MSFVLEKLYLGGIDEASRTRKLRHLGVTHILTVDMKPLPIENREGFEYKYVHALDLDTFDLLERIPECLEFIEAGRNAGGVLVHCHAGQSRSATLILAYIMQKMDICLSDALILLKKQKSDISPNRGFQTQLQLFEEMGNKIDVESQCYKQHKLLNLAVLVKHAQVQGSALEKNLAADPSLGIGSDEIFYKCRKCRRPLFKHSAVLTHVEGLGEAAFDWRKDKCDKRADNTTCTQSMFIEPVQWMSSDVLQVEGKLSCPKCSAKLGSFKWTGEQCPCGTWVIPAFHIQNNKVDQARHRMAAPMQTGRKPIVLRPSQGFQMSGEGDRKVKTDIESAGAGDQNIGQTDQVCQSDGLKHHCLDSNDSINTLKNKSVELVSKSDKEKRNTLELVSGMAGAVGISDLKLDEDLPPLT